MPLPIIADSWVDRHDGLLVALGAVLATVLALWIVDHWFGRQVLRGAAKVAGGDLSPSADTRLRILRRVIDAAIVVIGLTIAISQVAALGSLTSALFASSALIAAVIGFAARQPVANAVAGIVLAATQPIRIGDLITVLGESGVVEDVRLTSTVVRTASGAHLVVPNETLVQNVVRNESRAGTPIAPEVDVWLPHGVDVAAARAAVAAIEDDVTASVAETTTEGFRLFVTAPAVPVSARKAREAELRLGALDAVRRAGLQD
jgi:small-conductance mechanosensitive channel